MTQQRTRKHNLFPAAKMCSGLTLCVTSKSLPVDKVAENLGLCPGSGRGDCGACTMLGMHYTSDITNPAYRFQ